MTDAPSNVAVADPPVASAPAPDWKAGLTGDYAALAADPALATFKGKDWAEVGPVLAKSYIETKKLVGSKQAVAVPGEHATPEQVAAYRKALGVPDEPAGYQIRRPDVAASEWDDTAEAAFLGKMHELAVPPKAVQAILDWYGSYLATQSNAWRNEAAAAQQELRREWGPAYDAHLGRANRAIQQYGGDALIELFARTGLGRDPLVVKAFAKIGNDLVEHGAMPADHVGTISPDEARERLTALQAELLKVPTNSPRAKQIIDDIVAVTKIAQGGRT